MIFQIPHSNDFNAISKTRHVIVLALCMATAAPGSPMLLALSPSSPSFQQLYQQVHSRLPLLLGSHRTQEVQALPVRSRCGGSRHALGPSLAGLHGPEKEEEEGSHPGGLSAPMPFQSSRQPGWAFGVVCRGKAICPETMAEKGSPRGC